MSLTNAQVKSIQNYSVAVYFGGVPLGVFDTSSTKISFKIGTEKVTSSRHGMSAIGMVNTGIEENTIEIKINSYNKFVNKTIFGNNLVDGATATVAGTPFTGAQLLRSYIGIAQELPLVLYPFFTDVAGLYGAAGVSYIDNVTNPLAILYPKAVAVEGLENIFSAENVEGSTIKFEGIYDYVNNYARIQDDGITTAGVYTP